MAATRRNAVVDPVFLARRRPLDWPRPKIVAPAGSGATMQSPIAAINAMQAGRTMNFCCRKVSVGDLIAGRA
jgi:hypothetical protein